MRSQRNTLILTALLTLATACQRPDPPVPAATLPTPVTTPTPTTSTPPAEPSPSPTPPPPPDYSVPEVIDTAYAERVLEALFALESEAVREIVQSGALSERAEALLRATYRPDGQADLRVEDYRNRAGQVGVGLRENPGDQGFDVDRVLVARSACAYVAGRRDFSLVLQTPTESEGLTYVQILPKVGENDPQGLNPTPWMIGGSEYRPDGSTPEDACEGW